VLPLIAKRSACNIAPLYESIAYMLFKRWDAARQLQRYARDELACMADISAAAREEETGSEALLVKVCARDSACDRGLSRAGQAVKPEDATPISSVGPFIDIVKEVDAGIREAERIVLSLVRVERRICSGRKEIERVWNTSQLWKRRTTAS
jgi:hypothetical protein